MGCPMLVVVKRLKPLMALTGTIYRLASSMSEKNEEFEVAVNTVLCYHMHCDHTPVLFNVFEEQNEKSAVPRISFCFICN